jgi:hypothetical protein
MHGDNNVKFINNSLFLKFPYMCISWLFNEYFLIEKMHGKYREYTKEWCSFKGEYN